MSEARCLKCDYLLRGLESNRCPECGTPFDLAIPSTYSIKPPFVRWRFWLPGLILSTGVGLGLMALFAVAGGFGIGFAIVGPFCAGALLGYACRVAKFVRVVLIIIVALCVVAGLMSLSLLGAFCALATLGVLLGPLLIGTICGAGLRIYLKGTTFDQKSYLPILMIILTALLLGTIEVYMRQPAAVETVATETVIDADRPHAWAALMLYEEVHAKPPLLLRLLLPRPLGTHGRMESVGDVKTCVYSKGYLRKRVTEIDPGKRLAFVVTEQVKIETRSVRLVSGSFELDDAGSAQTRVILTTSYEPLLSPRWEWRPIESWAVHTLHRYVLQGMSDRTHERTDAPIIVGNAAP